jgi:hypothetical protein
MLRSELRSEDFVVRLALTTTTHSGRNDSPHDFASLSPVGVDQCELDAIGRAEGYPSNLTVVLTRVDAL